MGWILQGCIGICLIIATGGVVNYFLARSKGGEGIGPKRANEFEERLNGLERRLTDIQDVMIAIDEKLSRIERQNQ
jgi:hypothetical protein